MIQKIYYKDHLLLEYYLDNQFKTIAIYFIIYVVATALSLPGATIITLVGGAGWQDVAVSFVINGLILIYIMLPSTKRAFGTD